MSIKKYIFFSLVFIFIVALYVWNLGLSDYTFSIFAYSWTYSIFIWFLAPLVVLFFFSLLHIIFYSLVNFLNKKTVEKDIDRIEKVIKQKLLSNEIDLFAFKTTKLKNIANFIDNLKIDISDDESEFDGIESSNIKYLQKIKQGEHISSRKLFLDKESPYYKQNIINKIKTKDDYAKEVFNSPKDNDEFSDEFRAYAFCAILKANSINALKQIIGENTIDKKGFLQLLYKDAAQSAKSSKLKEQTLSNVEILTYSKDIKLEKEDYFDIAKTYLKNSDPDKLISLFDDWRSQDENATNAYLYILAEYEMLDKLRDIVSFLKPDDIKPYKALLDLKDASKQYKISDFVI